MRDTIIFSGASHTFGLGLEWELDPELNSEEYLQKGIHIPIPRLPHYQNYWKEYRWPSLVSNETNYKQFNIHDEENKKKYEFNIGGNAVETIWYLVKSEKFLESLLLKTKYIILEVGGNVRWYDKKLHGGPEGYKYPNTILEMIDLINNPKSDGRIVAKTLDWINNIDPIAYMLELENKIEYLQKKYSDIHFLILVWQSNILTKNIIPIVENGISYKNVNEFLQKEKIQVWHKAKAFNGNYKYNVVEEHASIEGHRRVANMVIEHIKKLENEQK